MPTNSWVNTLWYLHTIEYYSAMKMTKQINVTCINVSVKQRASTKEQLWCDSVYTKS
jgi:hypothetical protein